MSYPDDEEGGDDHRAEAINRDCSTTKHIELKGVANHTASSTF